MEDFKTAYISLERNFQELIPEYLDCFQKTCDFVVGQVRNHSDICDLIEELKTHPGDEYIHEMISHQSKNIEIDFHKLISILIDMSRATKGVLKLELKN